MTRRYVRITLFVGLLLALGAATYQIDFLERSLAAEQARREATAQAATASIEALLEVRASERAFLAEGQGAPYWQGRLHGALARLTGSIDALRTSAAAAGSNAWVDSTDETLARLLKVESRIADHALAGRRPHAEDLIFADALQASAAIERDVRAAAQALDDQSGQRVRDVRLQELIVVALAASAALLVALLLVPVGAGPRVVTTAEVAGPLLARDESDLPLNLRETPRPTPPPPASAPAPMTTAQPVVPGPVREVRREPDRAGAGRLVAAADLCGALARVQDARDLPSLLAHVTRLLHAQGTILWLADVADRTLKPALTHGYRADAVARLGVVPWDAPNPTAEAFGRREPRVMEASSASPGALVVPLVSASGCAGVVTVELKAGASPDGTTIALARIFAAQLAGFIAPAAPLDTAADAARAAATPAP